MALKFFPNRGDVLICDFSGFNEPEMTKRRPVVVMTPRRRYGPGLVTVVPLSTTAPDPVQIWNTQLFIPMPAPYDKDACWVKGDMLYSVSFERLNPFRAGKDSAGKRIYETVSLSPEQLAEVEKCVLNGLGFFDQAKEIEAKPF
ncbi:MAG: type II toxin-antitoxin system PemK/MazF family toxin [Duodenibacillus sp.]|nr:type II toxin-antitoxin system PemK/MazF family toxin [Duodenibacillus sp.]